MSENATHVIIHHYIEKSPSFNCDGVACCIILIALVVILFLIIAGVVIYIIIYLSKHRHLKRPNKQPTREMHGYDNAIDGDTSSCNAATAATSTERDVCENDNDNAQSIPMTTFRTRRSRTDGRDSSDSSAGLYDVLFPENHEGEVMYDPPTKLMTFAGQVYESGPSRVTGSYAGPSGSGRPDSESLVWDYFQQSAAGTPVNSEVGSDADPGLIDNICWV